ncbi:MAG: GAK system CofD-like protein [Desulfatirhabdiaceae bacterium]
MHLNIQKSVRIPDRARMALFQKCPELGPKILFFSGGSALRKLSQELIHYTHNSIHIITPFDSGGSSATLRTAFEMPAVGDIRNRLMALADQTFQGNPEVYTLFAHRLSHQANPVELRDTLEAIISGNHVLIRGISHPMRKIIRHHLNFFYQNMPKSFDLRGASIGNLVLAGGYFSYDRHLDPVIYIYSSLVQVRGTVRPVVNSPVHMAAKLKTGEMVLGQHRITGKDCPNLADRIEDIHLNSNLNQFNPVSVSIREKIGMLIQEADVICFPMGSFFSSILVNVLPRGVGRAVSQNPCPKIFIPNMGNDPELLGYSIMEQIHILIRYLLKDCTDQSPAHHVLTHILIDRSHRDYPTAPETETLARKSIQILGMDLVHPDDASIIDEKKLIPILLSLA